MLPKTISRWWTSKAEVVMEAYTETYSLHRTCVADSWTLSARLMGRTENNRNGSTFDPALG
ncbi:hypothetical protein [Nostoc sp. 'Lobaria pulmonaria (5183) cyanobiont']|uniref:hypothetical protein n=1 Tax=Nostoc sp. 'Lobaria pulmonaria (5183) cyanobiont' TaxID=1618022 RepID=UPI00131A1DE5|nr:hypothetical protein [Nostoc sp. 'Lobaria pulmonaria (5183) cyanobiont']